MNSDQLLFAIFSCELWLCMNAWLAMACEEQTQLWMGWNVYVEGHCCFLLWKRLLGTAHFSSQVELGKRGPVRVREHNVEKAHGFWRWTAEMWRAIAGTDWNCFLDPHESWWKDFNLPNIQGSKASRTKEQNRFYLTLWYNHWFGDFMNQSREWIQNAKR